MESKIKELNDALEVTALDGKNKVAFQFRTPAAVRDFADDPVKQQQLDNLWSNNLDGFTQQGMVGNLWNATNTPETTNYFNPKEGIPEGENLGPVAVEWSAFPGRLAYNFPSATQKQLNQMADNGVITNLISSAPCDSTAPINAPYYPYGPRGWQDEYCEWAVTRNASGKITRIDFTCDNPEYFNTLWQVDPNKVLEIYQTTLNKPQITLADLTLPNAFDPETGKTFYNPLNVWNSGSVSDVKTGGVMHLTSTPNTIQTEIGISSAATVLRNNPTSGNTTWPSSEFNPLLCCAQYGQKHRNSDPNIGGNINTFVNGSNTLTLTDPLGLYIQMPNFSNYQAPDQSDVSQYWKIVRGSETLNDQNGKQLPGNFILHAVFEIPSNKNFVVGDLSIGGVTIDWGSQVAATFKMQVLVDAYTASMPKGYDAVGNTSAANTYAQPVQLFWQSYYNAMVNQMVPNPVNHPISMLSNSTFIAPMVGVGTVGVNLVLTCATCTAVNGQPNTYPKVNFDDPNITASVISVENDINYAVPGNSLPSTYSALTIALIIGVEAKTGLHGLYLTNVGQKIGVAMPALLNVVHNDTYSVQANQSWQNTGIVISKEHSTTVTYVSGKWTANPNINNGNLYDANGNPTFIAAKPGYALSGANEGALIGYVGTHPVGDGTDTPLFIIGNGPCVVPTTANGTLWLCINDDLDGVYGAGLKDNIGSITVQINRLRLQILDFRF
jgi:hypothetical protein